MKRQILFLFLITLTTAFKTLQGQSFDPSKLASIETTTWEAYYSKDKVALSKGIAKMISMQYRISPTQAWNLVISTFSEALMLFGNMPHNLSHQQYEVAILPLLTKAYISLKQMTQAPWDPSEVAKKDLEWWIYRREKKKHSPEVVGQTMAEFFRLIYGSHDNHYFTRAAYLKAVAARYHDLCQDHWNGMMNTDWQIVQKLLKQCYKLLSAGITANQTALKQN